MIRIARQNLSGDVAENLIQVERRRALTNDFSVQIMALPHLTVQ
jgi:hypothetical protein